MHSFINNAVYKWVSATYRDYSLYFTGSIVQNGKLLEGETAAKLVSDMINSCHDQTKVVESLSAIQGHFAFCYLNDRWKIAMVDRKRSYPLFYHLDQSGASFSNCVFSLARQKGLQTTQKDAELAFQMAGYTIGKPTLIQEVYQLEAGQLLLEIPGEAPALIRYYKANGVEKREQSEQDWLQQLDKVHQDIFERLVQSLKGRQVVIPLSGGYDSRLILALLKKYGHDNIKTYTYGWSWLWEVRQAQQVARLAGVEWTFIKLDRKALLKRFHGQDRKDFYRFASGASSTPGIPEYYSIGILKDAGYLADDAVIINGQTGDFISGGHIPDFATDDSGNVTIDELLERIIAKHFALWTNMMEKGIPEVKKQLLILLGLEKDQSLSKQAASDFFERAEWSERQSKYVVNCVRAYEWFGYHWQLPLWDDAYMHFWDEVPLSFKKEQSLFKKYLQEYDPLGLFSMKQIDYTKTYPVKIKLARKAIGLKSRIFRSDRTTDTRHYLKYYMEYGPFFPQESYREYLKDSKYHRNAVSYWSRYVLNELP